MVQVSVIIVNYNTKQMTNECIDSIIKFSQDISYEIIVVDNGSTDGSKEFFENRLDIKYIYSDENLGFGKANNLGVVHAEGRYLFFLNSDTLLINNAIFELFLFYEKYRYNLNIGVLGATLIDENNKPNSYGGDFPTPILESKELFISILKYFGIRINRNAADKYLKVDDCDLIELDYVIGADMFICKEIFIDSGKFDEKFFMYYEESDLQLQIKKLFKLKNFILKDVNIIHFEGKSFEKKNINKEMMLKSKSYYFKKNKFDKNYLFSCSQILYSILGLFNFKYTLKERKNYFLYSFKLIYK